MPGIKDFLLATPRQADLLHTLALRPTSCKETYLRA